MSFLLAISLAGAEIRVHLLFETVPPCMRLGSFAPLNLQKVYIGDFSFSTDMHLNSKKVNF